MNEPQLAKDIDRFNEFLNELAPFPPEQAGLLREHLEAARASLAGSMPAELAFDLKLAQSSLDNLPASPLKSRLHDFLRNISPDSPPSRKER